MAVRLLMISKALALAVLRFFGTIGPLSYDLGSLYITHVGLSGLAMNPVFSMRFSPCRKGHEVNPNRDAIGADASTTPILITVILLSC